jgi:hypothetical protein
VRGGFIDLVAGVGWLDAAGLAPDWPAEASGALAGGRAGCTGCIGRWLGVASAQQHAEGQAEAQGWQALAFRHRHSFGGKDAQQWNVFIFLHPLRRQEVAKHRTAQDEFFASCGSALDAIK